ncbi:aspartate/tyrosine/aromatic aminotransferase [Comamonas sp. Z3]|uniref:amino acid aminotransferase n=1 Tax=Comamonas sp. Z3 TaxID=2601247 RepID=UPI0011E84A68|nr:amino acid aminotransferase [Comamonas sp. Z3]TYK67604.1 aspartate/tyrosine/aromatic aminotransferase [Comamonas sp. Z3]
MTTASASVFAHVPPYPGDPILSLMEAFQQDARADKVSLSIGLYFDEQGRLPVLNCVRQAAQALAGHIPPCGYLPIEGICEYRQRVQNLVFGADHEAVHARRIATLQTLGGSGALKVGADFIKHYFPDAEIWFSDPTWENHLAIFEGAGLHTHSYPYYDPATGGLRFDAMLDTLRGIPSGSVVLLHASCHNPTGVDLSREQWQQLIPVIVGRGLIPFVDMAYQGFGDGIDDDAWSVRALAAAGAQVFVANSFSKNFSLYGERVGGLSVVCNDAATAANVLGQLKATVRRNYSSPPTQGARLVQQVLQSAELSQLWVEELAQMRGRIKDMRAQLQQALHERFGERRDFGFLLSQRGMFSYTGITEPQVNRLREEHGVYLIRSGRMCMSGLSRANVQHVADAIAHVLA